jgi:hypothetical protein
MANFFMLLPLVGGYMPRGVQESRQAVHEAHPGKTPTNFAPFGGFAEGVATAK